MKKTKICGIFIIAALVAGFIVVAAEQKPETIMIGAILDSSGIAASQGESSRMAIDLAMKEINENGGVLGKKLEVVYQDDSGDPKKTVSAFYNLLSQDIHLIVGPNQTPAGSAIVPLLEDSNAVVISPSAGSEKFSEESANSFNTWPPDQKGTFALAEYMYSQGYRKVAIFGSQQEWEQQQALYFKEHFENIGGLITEIKTPLVTNKDLRTESAQIIASSPEAVVFTNYGETSYAARRLRDLDADIPFYSVLLDETSISSADGSLEGIIYITSYTPSDSFIEKFKAEYGIAPGFPADTAYDAFNILIEAIKRADTIDTQAVLKELNSFGEWIGASGNLTFDEVGNVHKQSELYVVKDGGVMKYE